MCQYNHHVILEIVREVETNGNKLSELLRGLSLDDIENGCLENALLFAIRHNNHLNVGRLVMKGATNLDEGMKLSIDLKKHNAALMILLALIVKNNDKDLFVNLFDECSTKPLVRITLISLL